MIQANHPRFSCTSDMSLNIYGIIFSGPFMHTDTPSGTGVLESGQTEKWLDYAAHSLQNIGQAPQPPELLDTCKQAK